MPNTVIKADQLGKSYLISHQQAPSYQTLRDSLASFWSNRGRGKSNVEDELFWALREVSFDVKEGERVGIIGRNGSGKSTLLKLISRITEPSTGRISLKGKFASLLEVGTGFHLELTGRENIYLNGSILGMSRMDISRRFEQIVEFSGLENFLDTPVKRYSSGMQTRLAFAISAHLEPDVMLVDEVLAVGDAEFQKKCLNKMGGISETGRTILFVSHNMNAIEQLCERIIWINDGRIVEDSRNVRECIHHYLAGGEDSPPPLWRRIDSRFDTPVFMLLGFYLGDSYGNQKTGYVSNDESVFVTIELDLKVIDPALCLGFTLYSADGELFFWSYQTDHEQSKWPELKLGRNLLTAELPKKFLNEGEYRVSMIASLHCREWYMKPGQDAPNFNFKIQGGLSQSPYWTSARPGLVAPVLDWKQISG